MSAPIISVSRALDLFEPRFGEAADDWHEIIERADPAAKRHRPTRRRLVVGLALLATLVIATAALATSGLYPFADDHASSQPGLGSLPLGGEQAGAPAGGPPATTAEVEISGGSPAQRALAAQILARMGETPITSVTFGPVPTFRQGSNSIPTRWSCQPPEFSCLTLSTNSPTRGMGAWDGALFASAFADLSRNQDLPTVFGYMSDRSGGVLYDKNWDMTRASPPAATDAEAAALAARINEAVSATAGASDVEIVSLRVIRPERLAFMLILQVSDPAAYMKYQLSDLFAQIHGKASLPHNGFFTLDTEAGLAGSWIALQDADGTVVWTLHKAPHGGGWGGRPDLRPCNPIQLGSIANPLRPRPGAPDAQSAPTCPA